MSETGPINEEARPTPLLFLVLQAHQPLGPALRVRLDGLATVILGRGRSNEFEEESQGWVVVRLQDPWMSGTHAQLQSALGRWRIDDLGSKNGTQVNGEPLVGPRVLADGDLLEVGQSFLLFRTEVGVARDERRFANAADGDPAFGTILPPLARRYAMLAKVAATPTPIVIGGPSGAGKQRVARAVHALSRRKGAFVAVNCGALPKTLVEPEVFGYRRADGGTLFLDEVGELSPAAQAAFLRVLQAREVTPMGETDPPPVDLRIVSATHRDLDGLVAAGTLREDLCHRLAGFRIDLPPLRERREDLGMLVAALLRRHARDPEAVRLDPKTARLLLGYAWPGNVRELERCLADALPLAGRAAIAPEHLPPAIAGAEAEADAPGPVRSADEDQRERLVQLLSAHQGNVAAVARELGKAPVQIRRWLKRHGLDAARFRH